MHEDPAGGLLGPVAERPVVPVDLLAHRTADAEPMPPRPGRAAERAAGAGAPPGAAIAVAAP